MLCSTGRATETPCEEVAEKIRGFGSEALIEMCDIGERDKVLAMAQSAIEKFGSVDVLVNNAAVRPDGGFLTISEAEWNRVYDTNSQLRLSSGTRLFARYDREEVGSDYSFHGYACATRLCG